MHYYGTNCIYNFSIRPHILLGRPPDYIKSLRTFETTKVQITIKLGGISYLKSLFMFACLIAPAVIMYLIGDAIKDLYDFSKDFKENPSLTDLIDSINHLLLSIGAGLAIGIAVTAFCLGLLIIYRTRKLEKDE